MVSLRTIYWYSNILFHLSTILKSLSQYNTDILSDTILKHSTNILSHSLILYLTVHWYIHPNTNYTDTLSNCNTKIQSQYNTNTLSQYNLVYKNSYKYPLLQYLTLKYSSLIFLYASFYITQIQIIRNNRQFQTKSFRLH